MKYGKLMVCLALSALISLSPVLAAEVVNEADALAPQNTNVFTIAYENLQGLIERSNTTYLVVLANIDAAEVNKQRIVDSINQTFDAGKGSGGLSGISSMWSNYGSIDDTIEEMIKELPRTIGAQTAKAQNLFYQHYILTLREESATAKLETLIKDRETQQARLKLGLISPSEAAALDNQITTQKTAVDTAGKEIEKNILSLKSVLGISLETEIALGELPAGYDPAEIMERVFADDLALFYANSKTLESAQESYEDAQADLGGGSGSRAAVDSQRLALEQTKIEMELSLHSALDGLQNGYQSLTEARRTIDDLYDDQETLIRSYNLGLVAASSLRTMNESIREAENTYRISRLQWIQSYQSYLDSLLGY